MDEYDVDILVYPTVKNLNLKLKESGVNAPGSSLGSVIGYPSITVPMGYIDEFAYGLEFFSIKNSEDLLYSVARTFENINNLDIVNSSLTPSLYEIPDYINELKEYYEKYYNDKNYQNINSEVKTYFSDYTTMDDEEAKNQANELIEKYKTQEKKEKISNKIIKKGIIIGLIILSIIFIYFLIHKLFKKRRKKKI
jgi:hypothetical protein